MKITLTFADCTIEEAKAFFNLPEVVNLSATPETPEVVVVPTTPEAPEVVEAPEVIEAPEVVAAPEVIEAPEVDATGQLWNPALHASTKAKTQTGVWKKRRGAIDTTVPVPPAPASPVPPAPASPVPPAPVSSVPQAAYAELIQAITAVLVSGRMTIADVHQILGEFGIPDVQAVSKRPELFPALMARLL